MYERGGLGCTRLNERKLYVILDQADLGSANLANLEAVRRILAEAVEVFGDRTVEVELNAHIVGASFVNILAQVAAQLRSRGGRLKLTNVKPHVLKVLAVCGYEGLAT